MSILTTILFWVGILGCIAFLFFAFDSQEIVFFGISILFGLLILGSCICHYNFSYCPNCNYHFAIYQEYDYCPQCRTKLINKCDNCGEYLSKNVIDNCPYCGSKIDTRVGEISSVGNSTDKQYSKCPNCEKSLKDMKDIDNCPYCGFELTHITNKLTECQYCHRSLDGMEHIGDKCPYCGNLIEKDDDKNVHIR